jgi:hypothetical protein
MPSCPILSKLAGVTSIHIIMTHCILMSDVTTPAHSPPHSTLRPLIIFNTLTWVSVISTMYGLKATRCERVKAIQRKEER